MSLDERAIFRKPFLDPSFQKAYGSSSTSKHHHSYPGGLDQHTREVVVLADMLATIHDCWSRELMIAAAWHDYGKIFDYDENGVKLPGRDKSSHIKDSIHNFEQEVCKFGLYDDKPNKKLRIWSMIGSHHGKIEWGSLSVPKAVENKILHTADYISAITNNLDLDVLHTGNRL